MPTERDQGRGHGTRSTALDHFASYIEELALLGAVENPTQDKTGWVRVWVAARRQRGQPTDTAAWVAAYRETWRRAECSCAD